MQYTQLGKRALDVTLSADQIAALEAPYKPHVVKGY